MLQQLLLALTSWWSSTPLIRTIDLQIEHPFFWPYFLLQRHSSSSLLFFASKYVNVVVVIRLFPPIYSYHTPSQLPFHSQCSYEDHRWLPCFGSLCSVESFPKMGAVACPPGSLFKVKAFIPEAARSVGCSQLSLFQEFPLRDCMQYFVGVSSSD